MKLLLSKNRLVNYGAGTGLPNIKELFNNPV